MKRRSSLVLLAVLALAAFQIVSLVLRRREVAVAEAALGQRSAPESIETPSEASALEVEAPREDEREAVAAERATEVTPQPAAEPAPASLELSGRMIALDQGGAEQPPPDGSFELILWRNGRGEFQHVPVARGSWRLSIPVDPPVSHVTLRRAQVGDDIAAIESPTGEIRLPAETSFDVRVRIARRSLLSVRSAVDGANLADVVVVSCEQFPDDQATHPGRDFDERVLASGLVSPIDVGALLPKEVQFSSRGVLVGCDGFAWARVTLDLQHGGERTVSLERAGTLELELVGVDARSHAQLRLRTGEPDSRPLLSEPIHSDGTSTITGLAPGDYTIRGEVGEYFRDPLVLGEVAVRVEAGATAHATLTLAAAPKAEFVDVSGALYVPEAWKLERAPMVVMKLLDTPLAGFEDHHSTPSAETTSDRAGFQRFAWSWRRMQVGRYELGLYKPPFSIAVEIPPGGRDDFELVLPSPVEVSVRVVDDATGADAEVERVHWNCVRPEGVTAGTLEVVKRNPATLRYEFVAPDAELELSTSDWRYLHARDVVRATAPRSEHTLRVAPACGFVLKLADGETTVPIPNDWFGQPRAVAGEGSCGMTSFDPLGRRFCVSEPGSYSIEVPRIAGYRPHAAAQVDVPARQFVELVVQLEREHP